MVFHYVNVVYSAPGAVHDVQIMMKGCEERSTAMGGVPWKEDALPSSSRPSCLCSEGFLPSTPPRITSNHGIQPDAYSLTGHACRYQYECSTYQAENKNAASWAERS
jgi:hypothetical protein